MLIDRVFRLIAFSSLFAISLTGCSVISPPPFMPQLAGTPPNAPGDMRLLVVVGVGGGIFTGAGFGGELRFEGQVNEWATVGGGAGIGYNGDSTPTGRSKANHPDWIYAARTWGRFNPGSIDWLALSTGAGISGTNRGTVALTFDGAALFGGAVELGKTPTVPDQAFRLMPYGGPTAAISIPLRQGDPIRKQKYWFGIGRGARTSNAYEPVDFTTTVYIGGQVGLAADSGRLPAWTGALDVMLLGAFSKTDGATIFAFTTGQGARFRRNGPAKPPTP